MAAERRRGVSVRLRTTIAATLVVAAALAVGSFAFVALVETSLVGTATDAAERDAESTADLLEDSGSSRLPEIDDALLQLYDDGGSLVATTDDAEGLTIPPADFPVRAEIDGETHIVVGERVEIADVRYELRLAAPLSDALDGAATVARLLLVSVPVLLAVIALVTWLIVGRALRPVETIRRQVDAIGASELGSRVAEPPADDEVGRLARTMNRMLERLDRSARAQRRFTSDASHELRSPLASLRQHAELARAHPDRIDSAELAEVVLAEGDRLQDLVESLLILARLDENPGTIPRETVDLDDLVLSEARRARASRVHVDTSAVGAARVEGDPRMLARTVRNLVDNAVRHADSRIAVGTVTEGGRVIVTVDDDGAGVDPQERERVFERFVRLDEARARDAGGSGLGLAIVADVARAHGGSVEVTTSALGGARFRVELPASG